MHNALQIEPDLNPNFENKVQGSFRAPTWLLLGPSFRLLQTQVLKIVFVKLHRESSCVEGQAAFRGCSLMGPRFKECPQGALGHKYLESSLPTQGERGLFIFVVEIQCLTVKIVTEVAGANFLESV